MSRYEFTTGGGDLEINAGPQIQNPSLPRLMSGTRSHTSSPLHARLKAFSRALQHEAKTGKCRIDMLDRYAQLAHQVKQPKHSAEHWKKHAIHKLRKVARAHKHKLVIAGYDFVGAGLQPPELESLQRMTTERGMNHLNQGSVILAQLFGTEQAAKTLEAMAQAIREGNLR